MSSSTAKAASGIGCGLLTPLLLVVVAVIAIAGSLLPGNGVSAAPSTQALADIPPYLLALYRRAEPECPGLSWTVLAAIGKVETDHSRHPTMISSAGAVGPMQFLPSTFAAYAHPVPPGGKRPPTPWDAVDAVYAAARLLCAGGARNGQDLRRAIWHYNHSDAYVNKVLKTADRYAAAAPAPTGAAATAVAFAHSQLGSPYVWGGDGPAEGGFDCSGLTQAAYRAAHINIPRVAQAQYDAGPRLPRGKPLAPGDLLFFGSHPTNITHVSLYTGNGRAIDAPRPGATVREAPARTNSPSYQGATRPAARGGAR
ncbi:bifunctional lytic transglycosylase/C40 family peptidase [Streptomyces sp. Ru87]|uniref:C40 family peptidase n=1 Tax=Streptomyces sp. Ru87 TaxID=2044307 RepID=UPI000BF5F509|nr:bifunctional lytic transglycosylase/C40 family peptidase [Streptomyces sp. Ru87]PGH46726.1 hydrolase Nlp/P60 [Streptomyces sp. Ru87]